MADDSEKISVQVEPQIPSQSDSRDPAHSAQIGQRAGKVIP